MPDEPDFDLTLDAPAGASRTPDPDVLDASVVTPRGRDLGEYDLELLLDMSGSMARKDCPGGRSRWEYAHDFAVALTAKMVLHDKDGIVVVPFNHAWRAIPEVFSRDKVDEVFRTVTPDGATDTAGVLQARLDDYFAQRRRPGAKKRILFVVTDGEPSDGQAGQDRVVRVIKEAQRKVDTPDELSIQFLQVGKDDKAAKFLKFLDDNLGEPDIVDTTLFADVEEMSFETLVDKTIDD